MRYVVFTGLADLDRTPWWPILGGASEVERILIVRRVQKLTPRQIARRFRRNVVRHGVLFIPYRIGLLAVAVLRRPFTHPEPAGPPLSVPMEEVVASDLHDPEVLARVSAFGADLGVSIGAPILRASLFRLPRLGTINLHLGKVPDFRGAPPGFWELAYGAATIGATVHWMDEGLDTGAVIASGEAPIYPTDSLEDVQQRATELGAHALQAALDSIARGILVARPQSTDGETHRSPTLRQRMALGRRMASARLQRRVAPRRLVKDAALAFALYVYRPVRDAVRTLQGHHPVRIFNFHRVTALCRDGMTVSPQEFEERIEYLARHHDVVSLEQAIALVRTGARLKRPVAVITFDDGYRSVHRAGWRILAERRLPAACFVSTGFVATDGRFDHDAGNPLNSYLGVMNWSELAELRSAGWSIGAHTVNHVRLSSCSGAALHRELVEPRTVLRDELCVDATVLAFPFGGPDDFSAEAAAVATQAGYTTVLANFDGETRTGNASLVLGRFDLGGDLDSLAWKSLTHGMSLKRWSRRWPS